MSLVVRKSARLISPFLVTYGIYLILYGHISPGGGFQGGVILGVSVILLITAYGYILVRETFRVRMVRMIESGSALGIILLAFSGLIFGTFFTNYLRGGTPGTLFSGGLIPFFNVFIGLKIGAAFTLVFYVLLKRCSIDTYKEVRD